MWAQFNDFVNDVSQHAQRCPVCVCVYVFCFLVFESVLASVYLVRSIYILYYVYIKLTSVISDDTHDYSSRL